MSFRVILKQLQERFLANLIPETQFSGIFKNLDLNSHFLTVYFEESSEKSSQDTFEEVGSEFNPKN